MLLADSFTLSPQALDGLSNSIPFDRRIFRLRVNQPDGGHLYSISLYRARFLPNDTVEVFVFHRNDASLGQCVTIPPMRTSVFYSFYEPSGIELPPLGSDDPASTTSTVPPSPTPPTARRPRARKTG